MTAGRKWTKQQLAFLAPDIMAMMRERTGYPCEAVAVAPGPDDPFRDSGAFLVLQPLPDPSKPPIFLDDLRDLASQAFDEYCDEHPDSSIAQAYVKILVSEKPYRDYVRAGSPVATFTVTPTIPSATP